MKKFLPLFIFVFSAAAFGQIDSPQSDISDDIKEKTSLASLSKQAGDESVARVLDDELTILGYNVPARLSILGDVGRENNWNRKTIFKGHPDPKNQKRNRGIISWQGTRLKKLNFYLKQEGLLGRGDDTELRGMARFMDSELQDEYPDVYNELATAKDTASASNALQKYIKYVPKRPYNSPDAEFKVRKNAVWAKKAKAMGLGQPSDKDSTKAQAQPRDSEPTKAASNS